MWLSLQGSSTSSGTGSTLPSDKERRDLFLERPWRPSLARQHKETLMTAMTETISTTFLSGWIHLANVDSAGDDLYLRIIGSLAGEEGKIRVCLVNAHQHGFPAEADDRIARVFSNWIELSGTFVASPLDDKDCDP
jgi:hypothetical protein